MNIHIQQIFIFIDDSDDFLLFTIIINFLQSIKTTNAMVDALVRDGTYRLGKIAGKSDATLFIILEDLTYKQVRSSTVDVLRSEELRLEVELSYQLIDANRPGVVLDSGKSKGRTRLFVDDNLQTARVNALPDALRRATQSIIARLADGI